MKIHRILLILLSVLALSCKKDQNNSSIDLSAIYFAGNEVDGGPVKPVYWNNNTKTTLPVAGPAFNGNANSIRIAGSDVYVAGEESEPSKIQALLWKNGVKTSLPTSAALPYGQGNDIRVKSGTVYVAGAEYPASPGKSNGVLWINGTATTFSIPTQTIIAANAVHLAGNEPVVAGNQNGLAAYWVNSNGSFLSNNVSRVNAVTGK